MEVGSILDAIKKYGFLAVVGTSAFLYLLNRVNTLEDKYETCMNERINDAYRMPRTSEKDPKSIKLYAILTDPIKVKKREDRN